jgi:hypothetical protein
VARDRNRPRQDSRSRPVRSLPSGNDDAWRQQIAGFDPTFSPPRFGDAVLSCPRRILIQPPTPRAARAACDRERRGLPSDDAENVTRLAIRSRMTLADTFGAPSDGDSNV